jgi:hypothetical protein
VIEAMVSEAAVEWEGEPIQAHEVLIGFGRIVVSEKDAPKILVNLV